MLKMKVFNDPINQEEEINEFLATHVLYGDGPINMFESHITLLYQDIDDAPLSKVDKIKHLRSLLKGHQTDILMRGVELAEREIDIEASEGSDEGKEVLQKEINQLKKFIGVVEKKSKNIENILAGLTA